MQTSGAAILFLTRKFPPGVGGMERFAFDLHAALSPHIPVDLIAHRGPNRLLPFVLPGMFLRAVRRGLSRRRRGETPVLHAQDGVLAPMGAVLSKLLGVPFTVTLHGLDMTCPRFPYQAVVPRAVRRADAVFCISEATAREARARGVSPEKVHVIPPAVTDHLHGASCRTCLLETLALPDNAQVLLTVGRLVERKGVAWFVEHVLPGLVDTHPRLVYVVVGDGPMRGAIADAARRVRMDAHVRLTGHGDDTLCAAAFNGADVFVMPNITVPGDMEGFGLVLLEASLCALPSVASDTEGIRDAVTHGENGVLVGVGDAAGFAGAISGFLHNPAGARTFGERSRAWTRAAYDWTPLAARYLGEFRRLCASC